MSNQYDPSASSDVSYQPHFRPNDIERDHHRRDESENHSGDDEPAEASPSPREDDATGAGAEANGPTISHDNKFSSNTSLHTIRQLNNRADELSFDHMQQQLRELETAITKGSVAVAQQKDLIASKQQDLSLQKNRY